MDKEKQQMCRMQQIYLCFVYGLWEHVSNFVGYYAYKTPPFKELTYFEESFPTNYENQKKENFWGLRAFLGQILIGQIQEDLYKLAYKLVETVCVDNKEEMQRRIG